MNSHQLRWLVLALIFLATLINYLDRQTLSIVIPVLMGEFHMTNVSYSHVVFAFMLAYTISNGLAGAVIDKLGTKTGYGLFMLWWSLAAIGHVFANGALGLGFSRFLLGIGEAGNWPAGVKTIAEWFPIRERALAAGVFNSGAAIGAIAAPPLIAWLLLSYGWHSAFVAIGMSGIVWLLLWIIVYRTPSQSATLEKRTSFQNSLELLKTRWMWQFMLSKMLMDPVWYFYIFWFPQYLKQARGFDIAAIGRLAWIPFATAAVGNLLGGLLSSVLLKRWLAPSAARRTSYAVFACLMTAAIPAVLVESSATSIALISVATAGYTGALANQLAIPADCFSSTLVASVWGLASVGSGFGGMLFSELTGWTIDHFSYNPVFWAYGILPLISAAITANLLRRPAPAQAAVQAT